MGLRCLTSCFTNVCDPLLFFPLGTTAVSSTTETTSTSMSLFKIPTAGAVTSAGTITTTTTQSIITPVLATGGPQGTTGAQKGPVTSTYISISQGSAVPLLQSQQASGSVGLLSNLSSIPGSSTGGPSTLTSTSVQTQPVLTASTSERANLSNAPTVGSQATIPQTTATASQGSTGFQLSSSASLFGNSPFTKPLTANQLTSPSDLTRKNTPGTNANSAQNTGLSFPGSYTLGTLGTLTNVATAGPGGFNFAATSRTQNAFSSGQSAAAAQSTSGTSSLNSSSTFSLRANTAQSSSVPSTSSTQSVFGQSANKAQGSFGSTTQNKVTFGSTNMKSITGQQSQSPFGSVPSNAPGFGSSAAQSAFGTAVKKGSTKSPFTFAVQANQNASQSAALTNPTQNAFGVQQQNQQTTPSAFGQASNSAFTSRSTDKAVLTFSSQGKQNTTQSALGSQKTQNVFESQPNQNANQGAFGTQRTQNAFGTQATQNAFGTPSNQKPSSSFSFAVNTAQNASTSSPISGFGNKVGTQSTFGAAPSQNAAGTSSGFSFAAAGNNPTPGGFNFNSAANKPTGFQFGKLHIQLSFFYRLLYLSQ